MSDNKATQQIAQPIVEVKAPEKPAPKVQTLAEVLGQRQSLIEKIKAIEVKGSMADDDPMFYALEGMRAKLNSIESSFGTLADLEITARLNATATQLVKDGVIGTESRKYLLTFEPGQDPTIGKIEGKKAARIEGEKRTKRKFAWMVDGKTEDTGATEVIRRVSDAVTLVRGEYALKDVLGVAARKGWKVAPALGPVAMRQQGKKVTTKDEKSGTETTVFHAHDIMGDDGKPIKLHTKRTDMYAHKFALIETAKDADSDAVKWAIHYLRDLIGECGVEDKAFKKKGATRNELVTYLAELQKNSEAAHAGELSG